MDYLILETYAVTYGVHAIVLSVIICVFRIILKMMIKNETWGGTCSYIEIAFAILAEFIYTLIFLGGADFFSVKSLSSALVSYSLSLVINSILNKIIEGKTFKVNSRALIIKSVISPFVKEEKLSKLSRRLAKATYNELAKEQLYSLLADNLISPAEEEEILALCDLILTSVENIE